MDHNRRYTRAEITALLEAVNAYRDECGVGDPTLAYELLRDLPESVTYDSTVKNIQRLRKGENIRGQTFLKAAMARY